MRVCNSHRTSRFAFAMPPMISMNDLPHSSPSVSIAGLNRRLSIGTPDPAASVPGLQVCRSSTLPFRRQDIRSSFEPGKSERCRPETKCRGSGDPALAGTFKSTMLGARPHLANPPQALVWAVFQSFYSLSVYFPWCSAAPPQAGFVPPKALVRVVVESFSFPFRALPRFAKQIVPCHPCAIPASPAPASLPMQLMYNLPPTGE